MLVKGAEGTSTDNRVGSVSMKAVIVTCLPLKGIK